MAMPRGSITCILCKGTISVRSGNLEKFKVHMESDHDVFYDHDILIAINFLEAHEKDVIVEKVLPRMRLLFDNVRSFNGKISVGDKLAIEKRLLENDDTGTDSNLPAKKKARYSLEDDEINEVDTSEMESSIELSDRGDEINLGDDSDDEDQIVQKVNDDDSEEENDAVSVGETLAESINSIRDILKDKKDNEYEDEFADCDVCHQSIRKSIFDFHRKSHLSAAKTTAECDICRKVMQKKSLYKHKKRCHILGMNRSNLVDDTINKDASVNVSELEVESAKDATKSAEVDVPTPSTNNGESQCYICKKTMLKGNIRRHIRMVHTTELDFKCKICFTGFQKLESLKWHTTKEHNLDLEDVEQMLQEGNEELSKDEEKRYTNSSDNPNVSVELDPQILEKVMKAEQDEPSDKANEGDTKKYKCDQCDNEYTNKDSVRRHMRKAHPQLVGHPSI